MVSIILSDKTGEDLTFTVYEIGDIDEPVVPAAPIGFIVSVQQPRGPVVAAWTNNDDEGFPQPGECLGYRETFEQALGLILAIEWRCDNGHVHHVVGQDRYDNLHCVECAAAVTRVTRFLRLF